MAELRPLTARDIKGTSRLPGDERRGVRAALLLGRAELVGLGPARLAADEFPGESSTPSARRYFLPPLDLDDDELAALQTCLFLLEGRFAYAEPLRLALQNLALGRSGGVGTAPTATAVSVEVRDPDYTPELQGRLGKLEAAISKQRTIRFAYWSIAAA
jgi:proteasome accessory factor C